MQRMEVEEWAWVGSWEQKVQVMRAGVAEVRRVMAGVCVLRAGLAGSLGWTGFRIWICQV